MFRVTAPSRWGSTTSTHWSGALRLSVARTVRRLYRRLYSSAFDRSVLIIFAVTAGLAMIGWLSLISWLMFTVAVWLFDLNG